MNLNRIQLVAHKLKDLTILNAAEFDTKSDECINWAKEILVELEKAPNTYL